MLQFLQNHPISDKRTIAMQILGEELYSKGFSIVVFFCIVSFRLQMPPMQDGQHFLD